MSRIFISYKRVDKDKVFKIKEQIETALGEKCWIDVDGIESDAVFASKIISAINSCEFFLFMYSKAHMGITDYENDWTIRELNFAQSKNKRIVFVNLDGSELTDWFVLIFGIKQQINGKNSIGILKLCQDIEIWFNTLAVQEREKTAEKVGFGKTEHAKKDITLHVEEDKGDKEFSDKTKIKLLFEQELLNKCKRRIKILVIIPVFLILLFGLWKSLVGDSFIVSLYIEQKATGSSNGYEWVDLGLPSGTKWATRNIGANNCTDNGSYYIWGETLTKSSCAWKFMNDRLSGENPLDIVFSKYTIDKKIELDKDDDVAHFLWGEGWRVPNEEQVRELLGTCKWIWTWSILDFCFGYKVIGLNGNSIFFPAAGNKFYTEVEKEHSGYWTSSLSGEESHVAWALTISSDMNYLSPRARCIGMTIRPVYIEPKFRGSGA